MCRSHISFIENVNVTKEKLLNNNTDDDIIFASSKLLKIKELVSSIIEKNEKIVIVSQWVGMIKLVQKYLNLESIVIDGSVSINIRHKNIQKFQSNSDIKICFISLMACAEGVNLTAANHVILIDNWYNKSKMIQVSERVNRIGQTKLVYIYKLSINNTVEQRITKYVNNKYTLSGIVLNKWSDNNESLFIEKKAIKLLDEDEIETNVSSSSSDISNEY
jgi:SNF2 family DNA or RNA helicase